MIVKHIDSEHIFCDILHGTRIKIKNIIQVHINTYLFNEAYKY